MTDSFYLFLAYMGGIVLVALAVLYPEWRDGRRRSANHRHTPAE
jgi:hypothetical protein